MTYNEALEKLQNSSPLRITIGGDIGAGKSTFAKRLEDALNLPRISVGSLMREEATRRGITLDQLSLLMEQDDSVDRYMDALQKDKSQEVERGIFDSRLSWFFVIDPKVTVFLCVDLDIAAQRIWEDDNAQRDRYGSLEELRQANIDRKASEETRYQRYYGITAYDHANYDVVIDTTHLSIEEVFQKTVIKIAEALQS